MTILTGGELEVLMGLRLNWGRLYSNEITRLQNEDDSADYGADLAHGPANQVEGVFGVLHEMPTDGDLVGRGVSRPTHPDHDRWISAHSQLTANVLRFARADDRRVIL